MADRGDTHYHVPTLNNWFLISSLLLLVTVVWMVIDDWNAPWKAYQREFRAIELERANETLAQPEFVAAAESEATLAEELELAEQSVQGRSEEIDTEKEVLRLLKGEQFVDTDKAKASKMFYDWERFVLDHDIAKYGDDSEYAEKIAAMQEKIDEAYASGFREVDDIPSYFADLKKQAGL